MKHPTSNIQHLTSQTKRFIAEFNFPEPDWSTLPTGFPDLNKDGLTNEEEHLLDGIKLAWVTDEGRNVLYRSIARRAVVGISILIISILLGRSLMTGTHGRVAKSVSAKTVSRSVEEFVEATMSAVFRPKN